MITEQQTNCKHEWNDKPKPYLEFCEVCFVSKHDWELYFQGVNDKNAEWLARIDRLITELFEDGKCPECYFSSDLTELCDKHKTEYDLLEKLK